MARKTLIILATIVAAALLGVTPAVAEESPDHLKGIQQRYVSSYRDATTLEELQFAPDFKAEHASVLRLYQAFFDREPDVPGAKYWLETWDRVKAEGVTDKRPDGHDYLGEFTGYFTLAEEFANNYGGVDNATFLQRVYRNMLDREPDPAGYDYWLSLLEGTNPDKPGKVLTRANAVRWITQNEEFIVRYPFGHADWSEHPSDLADCTAESVSAFELTVSGIYRLRDGAIRELCFGIRDQAVEEAWARMVAVGDPSHFSPVALLGVHEGSGAGIVAYAGLAYGPGNVYIGDLWLISAQDAATALDPEEADLTMVHELTHVFTQLDDQIDYGTMSDACGDRFEAFDWCFTEIAYMNQWVQSFWSADELTVYENNTDSDPDNDEPSTVLCVDGHDFTGSYATTSPQEDFAESFSAYVYGVELANQGEKYAWFDAYPELRAYRDRAVDLGRMAYPDTFGACAP